MHFILRRLLLPLISGCLLFPVALAGEWIDLFDGKTTKGWTPRSKVIRLEAKDGVLELHSKTNCCSPRTPRR